MEVWEAAEEDRRQSDKRVNELRMQKAQIQGQVDEMYAKFAEMEAQLNAIKQRGQIDRSGLADMLRQSEEQRVELDAKLISEAKRHTEFKRNL